MLVGPLTPDNVDVPLCTVTVVVRDRGMAPIGMSWTYASGDGSALTTTGPSDLDAFRASGPAIDEIVVFHPPRAADLALCGDPREGFGSQQPCGVHRPRESKEIFVERIVGLPGDRISIVRGHVFRNGVREHDPYTYDDCAGDSSCNFPMPVVIPRGDYFMMGDNRGAANDSRFWGPVPRSWLVGKVIKELGKDRRRPSSLPG